MQSIVPRNLNVTLLM